MTPLKIFLAIPGNLKTVPMNRFIEETLREMGHAVTVFNYGSRGILPRILKQLDLKLLTAHNDRAILGSIKKCKPDLFLTIYGFNHSAELVTLLRQQGITTACWWLNDPFQFDRSLVKAACYDFYFTNAEGSVAEYRQNGVPDAHYLPVGINPAVHRPLENCPKKYRVLFAGDWKKIREEILVEVAKDFPLALVGPWRKKLAENSPLRNNIISDGFFTPEEMVRFFNEADIVINIHTWFQTSAYGVNPRLFETCGCRALQISDRKADIARLYEEGKEVVLYDTVPELKNMIAYYLDHPAEREQIAENGYRRTVRDHTYRHRMTELLAICGLSR